MEIVLKNRIFMMNKLWIVFLMLSIFGCSKNESSILPIVDVKNELFHPDEVCISDVISEMKIIPLETNDSCLIGRGRDFYWLDKGILFYDIGLLKFGMDGSFRGNVFQFGQGPGEIAGLKDFYVRDSLIYFTDLSRYLYKCNFSGTSMKRIKVPLYTQNGFAVLENNEFVTGMLEWGDSDKAGRLCFFDTVGIKKKLYKPYSTEGKFQESYPMGREIDFFNFKKKTYMKELLNDTIYTIDEENDTIRPFLCYDFGRYKSHPEYRYNLPVDELFLKMPYTQFLGVTDKYVFLTVMMADIRKQESIDALCIYERQTGKSRLLRLFYSDDDVKKIKSIMGNRFDEKVSRYFFPTSLSQNGEYLCTMIPQIGDDNPAIIAVRLK